MCAICVVAALLLVGHAPVHAQGPVGTAFTYQGQLKEAGVPVTGEADFQFYLFDAASGGNLIDSLGVSSVPITDGLFTVQLDFGTGAFTGDARWLEIEVEFPCGEGNWTTLTPRQPVKAAPYALYALDGPGSAGYWAANGNDIYNTNSGKVGVGTTEPTGSLHVTNNGETHAIWAETTDIGVLAYRTAESGSWPAIHGGCASTSGGASGVRGYVTNDNPGPFAAGVYGVCTSIEPEASDAAGVRGRHAGSGKGVVGEVADPEGYAGYFIGGRSYFEGNVGIGAENPTFPLTIYSDTSGNAIWTSGQVHLQRGGTALKIKHGSGGDFHSTEYDGSHINSVGAPFTPALNLNTASSGNVLIANGGGNVGIGTTSPQSKLDVHGNVMIHSASSGALLIELGEGLDYAEGFDVSDTSAITPGMVLVIDADEPGNLAVSKIPYDRKVAGIVAGANGLGSAVRIGADRFDFDVALAGRVYCNVDGTHGAIQAGDLLTTSATPGYAMKVADYGKAQGAILGKAMEPLKQGEKGQILVLVTLQ
jgi:hypothetical protein